MPVIRVRSLATSIVAIVTVLVLSVSGCGASDEPESGTPPVAQAWVDAWNGTDPTALGALFTADATYTDIGVDKTSRGQAGITAWKKGTGALIVGARFDLTDAFRDGDAVAVRGTYRGRITGAPRPFAVPMVTILRLEDSLIAEDTDYYNLAELLRQSGLPSTWTPPAS